MQRKLTELKQHLQLAQSAVMIGKAKHVEAAAGVSYDLLEQIVDLLTLSIESYNGLSAYIDQCSNSPMEMTKLNDALKAANLGVHGGK